MTDENQTFDARKKEGSSNPSTSRGGSSDKRLERAHRILDAAATLILRWGYNKTTIDDIARQAGVAKGTIYLHWKTREELFAALVHRERLAFAKDFRKRISADPAGATLRGIVKHSALATLNRPLLKALLLRDRDVLGKLAQGEFSDVAYIDRVQSFRAYLESLREQDLIRTDLSLREQLYVWSVVYSGFFLGGPMMPGEIALPDEEAAAMMAETIHRTFETDRAVSLDEWQPISQAYMASVDRLIALAEEQFRKELEE
ncbi:MAG TPA: helix-turn-helix domain-containing protein [Anaerolineales bacterium]|nr:helix-turn-helix domain-containing protein [Anaerolineales bacterium]